MLVMREDKRVRLISCNGYWGRPSAIAGALQIELANPDKSLTATIRSAFPREGDRSFRQQLNIHPMLTASALWAQTHPALAQPASAINRAIDGRSIFDVDVKVKNRKHPAIQRGEDFHW